MRLPDRKGDHPACVDCVHSLRTGSASVECICPESSAFDPVEGRRPVPAKGNRTHGNCGMSGRYFQRRPGPGWFDRNVGRIVFVIVTIGAISYLGKGWLW